MGVEIERKFLVKNERWRKNSKPTRIMQAYLSDHYDRIVRVRIHDDKGCLTIKNAGNGGLARKEFEYEIPVSDAEFMIKKMSCSTPIIKTRHLLDAGNGQTWEVDEFHGAYEGLIVAEIELDAENERFEIPDWLGEEVTDDKRYSNASLAKMNSPLRDLIRNTTE